MKTSKNWNDVSLEQEIQRRAIYELEADKLIAEGGINTKSVSYITDTANRIKEQMDKRIRSIVDNDTILEPIFFIQSRGLYKIWKRIFRGQYSTNNDMFKQAFSYEFGDDILSWKRMQSLAELAKKPAS